MSTVYEKYEDLKDSGVEWIYETPKEWGVVPISKLFNISRTKAKEAALQPLSTGYMGVVPQLENVAQNVAEGDRKIVKKGDIVINSRSDRMGAVGLSNFEGGVSLIYHVIRKKKFLAERYYHYVLRNVMFSQEFYRWGRGIVADLWTTRDAELKRILVTEPPIDTQKRIAKFLDVKTEKIGQVIEEKKKLIKLLKEQRNAIITKAVTKGINANVRMKDSGVEWIGEMPNRWKIIRLRFLSNFVAGVGFSEDLQGNNEGDFPFLKVSDINSNQKYVSDSNNYISKEILNLKGWKAVKTGSIIMAKIGAALAKNHRKILLRDSLIDNNMMAVRKINKLVNNDYFYWIWQIIDLANFQNISSVPSVDMDKLKDFFVPITENKEQKQIADFLDEKTERIDKSTVKIGEQINYLKEYRVSLIYNAVTGKIKI